MEVTRASRCRGLGMLRALRSVLVIIISMQCLFSNNIWALKSCFQASHPTTRFFRRRVDLKPRTLYHATRGAGSGDKSSSDTIMRQWSFDEWEKAEGKTLVIVESPAKAKTIQKYLDEDKYIVDFSAGHVRDLPSKFEKSAPELKKNVILPEINLNVAHLGVDVANDFEPVYVTLTKKVDVVKRLRKSMKSCSRLILATDEDREGEAISWHLLKLLDPSVPFKRAVFHEITKEAILESFKNPRDIDMDLVESQETRRVLDRLAGYTVSPVLWRYVATGLSAGRVQSCGLNIIAQVSLLLFLDST